MKRRIPIHILTVTLLFFAGSLYAMDTDLYTGKSVAVPPNVLIIFDTSGSMEDEVVNREYDPTYDYSSEPGTPYTNDYVYVRSGGYYNVFATSVSAINCSSAKDALNTKGTWSGYIRSSSPYNCGGHTNRNLFTGRYLNYYFSEETTRGRKIDVARDAIKGLLQKLLDDGIDIRVGLMRFNGTGSSISSNIGGRISVAINDLDAAQKALLDAALDGYQADGGTPLAESLAEAGLYFAGKQSWANSGKTTPGMSSQGMYTSPIRWRCQQNHIILMTDGNSQVDQGDGNGKNIFTRSNYMNGRSIGDRDNDGADPGTSNFDNNGTHWLDDVAKFLYDEDLIINGTDEAGEPYGAYVYNSATPPVEFERQNIHTHTIGFATGTDEELLRRAAAGSGSDLGSHGNGLYRTTYTAAELKQAFTDIFGSIVEKNVNLSAPVVPVSQLDQNYSGRNLYVGMFHPLDGPFWYGNIKKFVLDKEGNILQKDKTPAVDGDGVVLHDASTCYQNSDKDGFYVNKGGVGAALLYQTDRKFYTYKDDGTAASDDLTASSNEFGKSNADVLTQLGAPDPEDLIDFLRAEGAYHPQSGQPPKKREWVLGDLLHSKPVIQQVEGTHEKIMLVGSNDGFFHCFIDDDKGDNEKGEGVSDPNYLNDEVREAWSFVPWTLIPRLKNLKTEGSTHQIFVDGSPVLYPSGSDMLVTFGLRRGGEEYYTLDVGNYSDGKYTGGYASPLWKWSIQSDILSTENLGQSWCTPRVGNIKVGGDVKTALFLSGGYDPAQDNDHYDSSDPGKTPNASDSRGRAVYAVDASNGSLLSTVVNFNYSNYPSMTHCIVDLLAYDSDSDENHLIDTIYAGDMGGNLFVFHDRDATGNEWNKQLLFKARDGATANDWLKFMYYPAVKKEIWGDYVFIGTGDRENPNDMNTYNYFFAIKNRFEPATIPWAHLYDVSGLGLDDYNETIRSTLTSDACKGWYIRFPNEGEKVVSYPVIYDYRDENYVRRSLVIFTTFTPDPPSTDQCNVEVFGGARVYMLDYKTGAPGVGTNRSTYIGKGMPSAPQIIYLKDEDDETIVRAKLIVTSAGNPENEGNQNDLAPRFDPDLTLPKDHGAPPIAPTIRYWKQN